MEEYRSEIIRWMTPRADGCYSIAITQSLSTARSIPASRLKALAVFGATTALCILRGVSAHPLDPVLLHYFIHDCDLHSIHQQILAEWHPDLKQTIENWQRAGPQADVMAFQSHFATYHDTQVHIFNI